MDSGMISISCSASGSKGFGQARTRMKQWGLRQVTEGDSVMKDTRTGIWVGPDCTCAECQAADRQTHGVDMVTMVTAIADEGQNHDRKRRVTEGGSVCRGSG